MFTWLDQQRRDNFRRHGVDLAWAERINLITALLLPARASPQTQRWRAIGFIGTRLYLLVYIRTSGEKPQALRLRPATLPERRRYAQEAQRSRSRAATPKMPEALTPEELDEIAKRSAAARARARRLIELVGPSEEAVVVAAAEADANAKPLTAAQLARLRPAHEVQPDLVAAQLRRVQRLPHTRAPKQLVRMKLDVDVVAGLRALGKGWYQRVNDVLRTWLEENEHLRGVPHAVRAGRPEKRSVLPELDADVAERLHAMGKGWHRRVNHLLRTWLEQER